MKLVKTFPEDVKIPLKKLKSVFEKQWFLINFVYNLIIFFIYYMLIVFIFFF